jgi:hypothetical protein
LQHYNIKICFFQVFLLKCNAFCLSGL